MIPKGDAKILKDVQGKTAEAVAHPFKMALSVAARDSDEVRLIEGILRKLSDKHRL